MDKFMNIVKNPIFIGIVVALITYAYFYFENNKKKDKENKKKSLNIVIPGIVGSIVWFLAGTYFDSLGSESPTQIPIIGGNLNKDTNVEFLNNVLSQAPVISHSAKGNLGYNRITEDIPLPNIDVFMDFPNF